MTLPPRRRISPAAPGATSVPVVVGDAQLEAGAGPAHGGGHGEGVVLGRRGRRRPGLGEPVAGDHQRKGQLLSHPPDELHRDVGRAGHRHPQGGEVVAGPVRVVEDRLVQRRRSGQDRHLLRSTRVRTASTSKTACGSMVAPAAIEARMPALSPNMWK